MLKSSLKFSLLLLILSNASLNAANFQGPPRHFPDAKYINKMNDVSAEDLLIEARAFYDEKKYEKATDYFRAAFELALELAYTAPAQPPSPLDYARAADCYFEMKNFETALVHYESAIALADQLNQSTIINAEQYARAAYVHTRNRNYQRVLELSQRAREILKISSAGFAQLGPSFYLCESKAYQVLGKLHEARDCYVTAKIVYENSQLNLSKAPQ